MGFRWVLLKLFLKVLHNIKYNYITTASFRKRLWMSDLYEPNIICFQTQRWFWLIYMPVISCIQKPLCVHVACTLITVCAICQALVIGLTHIPNFLFHQRTHLVQICSGPVDITNCCWHYKHTISRKTAFRLL